jgi:hypothetical protein
MSFGTYETPKPPTTPTFLQYIKTISKGAEGKTKFAVEFIWLPGTFQNVTLQTHAFRYICDESHPLFSEIQQYFESEVPRSNAPRLEIVISSIEDRTIEVSENNRKKGLWEKVGSNGLKFKES